MKSSPWPWWALDRCIARMASEQLRWLSSHSGSWFDRSKTLHVHDTVSIHRYYNYTLINSDENGTMLSRRR